MNHVINVLPDGTAETLGDVDMPDSVVVSKRRASTIEPANELKWVAFKLLRFVFGEEGKVAEWTRGWRGPWKCTITGSGLTHIERFRVACVRWEQQRITEIQMRRS